MNDGRMYTNFESNAKYVKKTMEKTKSQTMKNIVDLFKNAVTIMKQNQLSKAVESNIFAN